MPLSPRPSSRLRRWCAAGLAALAVATGATVAAAPPATALAGGTPVRSDTVAPWMATLAVRGTDPLERRSSCGGALVAPDAVLTAAHCIAGLTPTQVEQRAEIHVGATTLSQHPGQLRRIVGVAVHPRFALLHSPAAPHDPEADSATFDVAVLRLDRPVRGIAPLPVSSGAVDVGSRATFFGHGITSPTSGASDVLRTATFTVGTLPHCARSTPATVDPAAMSCATSPTGRACTGDSGGPLVQTDGRGPVLVGVFSFGMETAGAPCGIPGPDFFTAASAVSGWVARVLTTPAGGPLAGW